MAIPDDSFPRPIETQPAESKAVKAAFAPVFGKPCWNVKRGLGSFLTLEFGEPHLEIQEPRSLSRKYEHHFTRRLCRVAVVHGEWHLWIYCCRWFVFDQDERIGDSERHVARAVRLLGGQKLTSVTLNDLPGRTVFTFDLGARLCTRPYASDAKLTEQWMLYEPSGNVLTFRSDGSYCHAPGHMPDEQCEWSWLGRTTVKEHFAGEV